MKEIINRLRSPNKEEFKKLGNFLITLSVVGTGLMTCTTLPPLMLSIVGYSTALVVIGRGLIQFTTNDTTEQK